MDGQHGGKHYFEDNEYIESKKETTQTTVKSVQSAAKIVAERNKIAEAERREAERIAEERRQANGTYFTLENFTTEFDIERDIFALDYDANIRSRLFITVIERKTEKLLSLRKSFFLRTMVFYLRNTRLF